MTTVAQRTAKLQALAKELRYKQCNKLVDDVKYAFQTFGNLNVNKTRAQLPNSPQARDYISIEGTVPVQYKGNEYNIPVCLYLPETFPVNPCVVYVRPTDTMVIREGKQIDKQGRVYLPYLSEWRHPGSDLHGLLSILCIQFGEEMPVFSKQAAAAAAARTAQAAQAQYSHPAPAPAAGPAPGIGFGFPPTYPAQPPTSTYGGYPPNNYNAPTPGYPAPAYPPYGGQPPVYPPPATANTTYNQPPPRPSQPPGSERKLSLEANTMTVSDDHLRMSLVSAVEDKIRRRMREVSDSYQMELGSLQKTNADLLSGTARIDGVLHSTQRELNDLKSRLAAIDEKERQIDEALRMSQNSNAASDIDAVVNAPTAVHRQILTTHAEDLAIEDTLYHLGAALNKDRVDVEAYLRAVRDLSRRQFLCRALLSKCRDKAGLPPV